MRRHLKTWKKHGKTCEDTRLYLNTWEDMGREGRYRMAWEGMLRHGNPCETMVRHVKTCEDMGKLWKKCENKGAIGRYWKKSGCSDFTPYCHSHDSTSLSFNQTVFNENDRLITWKNCQSFFKN